MFQEENPGLTDEKKKILEEIKAQYSGQSLESDSNTGDSEPEEIKAEDSETTQIIPPDITEEELEEAVNTPPVVMQVSEPLPKYGSGFKFIPIICGITVLAIILGHIKPITSGIPSAVWLRYTYIGFGTIFLFLGIKLIVDAVSGCSINENLQMGKLVTNGIYARTRNPIYAGVLIICTAALFYSGNAFMYILPVVYYFILSFLMKSTEEQLLEERFGDVYREYRRNTYMFVPFKKK